MLQSPLSYFEVPSVRKQAVDKVKQALPLTPGKRVEVVSLVLDSPTVQHALIDKGVLASSEQHRKAELHDAIIRRKFSTLRRKGESM